MNQYPDVEHPQVDKSRLGGYSHTYFKFCESAYSIYLERHDAIQRATNEEERHENSSEAFEHGVKAIIFAALCIEAAINDYGAWQLGDAYFKGHLNSLDVASKWVVVPRMVCGKELNKSGPGYSHLVSLIRARNELIHNQSMEYDPDDPRWPQLLKKRVRDFEVQVKGAYSTLLLLSLEFDYLVGPWFNPLPTLDKKVTFLRQIPANLVAVHAECKAVAARNRRS